MCEESLYLLLSLYVHRSFMKRSVYKIHVQCAKRKFIPRTKVSTQFRIRMHFQRESSISVYLHKKKKENLCKINSQRIEINCMFSILIA